MQDLESSLYYSLWVEVPLRNNFEGNTLIALKQYINVLSKVIYRYPQYIVLLDKKTEKVVMGLARLTFFCRKLPHSNCCCCCIVANENVATVGTSMSHLLLVVQFYY